MQISRNLDYVRADVLIASEHCSSRRIIGQIIVGFEYCLSIFDFPM